MVLDIEQLESRRLLAADHLSVTIEQQRTDSQLPDTAFQLLIEVENTGDDEEQVAIELESPVGALLSVERTPILERLSPASGVGFYSDEIEQAGAAGDLNGDGFNDMALHYSGRTSIVFGGPEFASVDLDTLDGSNGFSIVASDDLRVGRRISRAGDFNNDGFDDLILTGKAESGQSSVYVIFGGQDVAIDAELHVDSLDGGNGFAFRPLFANVPMVSDAGDVNGDGIDDILIGSTGDDAAGEGYLLFGGDDVGYHGLLDAFDLPGAAGVLIQSADNVGLGRGVAGLGDINADGFDDFSISAKDEMYVIYGAEEFDPVLAASDSSEDIGFTIAGSVGNRLASAVGDINGDQQDDFAVAMGEQIFVVFDTSEVQQQLDLSDRDSYSGALIDSQGRIIRFLSEGGDINHDGFEDMILGLYVLFGSADFSDQTASSAKNEIAKGIVPNLRLMPMSSTRCFCTSGDSLGDVNGDGIDDVVFSSEGQFVPNAWSAMVVFGAPATPGTGNLIETIDIPAGGNVIYEVTGILPEGESFSFTARATDESGSVSETITIAGPPPIPGDVNYDGEVSFADFLILSTNFGVTAGANRSDGDLDGDGAVNFSDFLILSENYGTKREEAAAAVDSVFAG